MGNESRRVSGNAGAEEKEMKHDVPLLNFRSREGLALLFALAVVLLIASLWYRSWSASGRQTDQMDVTRRTVSAVNGLLLAITNAETGQRGFLLTGEDRYLAPYRKASADMPPLLKALRIATAGRPDQARRIERLNPLIAEKLAELALTIDLRENNGLDSALATVRTDRGRELMGLVQGICSEISFMTNARLAQYSEEARSSGHEGGLISLLGGTTLFLLLLFANVEIQKGAKRAQSLISELQKSERRLQVAAAEAEAANRAKSTFLSTMSHEIRTPMNAILGYAQLMLRDPALGTDAKANLAVIGRSGEHLLGLINDVLDMSKIEAGRTQLNPTTFNLPRLLEDLAAMFRLRAEAKGLHFEMSVDGEAVLYVLADEGKIRQALINLLGNAIKFTKFGQITMQVTLKRKADQLWLSARVEDTGSGLSDEEQRKLFEPFTQTSRGLQSQEGTGLGLAISRTYARLMGGDITVTSEHDKGSIFRFEIPMARGDAAVAIKQSAPRRVIALRKGQEAPRILVVDDQLENRDWLMKLLTAIGFSVRVADDGEAAIRNWDEWNPQMILMDVHMPVMDGLEATRRIKADPRGKETAIVVLTASALEEDRRTVAASGADDFQTKPCREDELLEKMRVLLHLVYDYEEPSGTDGQSPAALADLSSDTLGQLAPELIDELRAATSSGNKKRLDNLILQVRETVDAGSAQALQQLADKYDYDALTSLLEGAASAKV
jgi:signal transduction histidine kinase/DNA-binding response OmpR family regulator